MEISVDQDDDLTPAQLKQKYEESRSQAHKVHVPGADVDRSGFEDVVSGEYKKRARKDDSNKRDGKGGKEKEKFKF